MNPITKRELLEGRTDREQQGSQGRYSLIVTFQVITAVVAVLAFIWFRGVNYQRIVDQNKNYIEGYTVQAALQLEENLNTAQDLVAYAAGHYATLMELRPELTIVERLAAVHDSNLFSRVLYVTPDGLDVNDLGVVDVSDRQYYLRGMAGETGWDKIVSRINGQEYLVFYAPVVLNGEVVGVLGGMYGDERIQQLFSGELFRYKPQIYLVRTDGEIVVRSVGAPLTGNLLSSLSEETLSGGGSFADIRTALSDPARRAVSFSYGSASHTFESAIAKPDSGDWMLVSILPDAVTNGMVSAVNQAGLVLMALLLAMFVANIFSTVASFVGQEKLLRSTVDEATAGLRRALDEERRHQAIIGSLSNIYTVVYYLLLRDGRYRLLRYQQQEVGENFPEQVSADGDIDTAVAAYVGDAVLPTHADALRDFLDRSTMDERLAEVDSVSIEYQRGDGVWCRATLVASEREADGRLRAVIFAVQIIQGEKEKELATQTALHEAYAAAEAANRAKTSFLSNMSHDMRTPLNAVIGMTAIAGSHLNEKERVAECLGKITASSRHLLQLINEVLDMSKIESGKVDLNEEEFSLSDLMENMLTLNYPLIMEHNHTLNVHLRQLTHERVIGDSVRLQQVFTNLLSNAAKYTPDGGHIKIELSERESRSAGVGWYRIVFEDNGMGMSEDYLKRIFEPFTRAENTRTEKIQGTGLGMAIARNIIRMMNGDITVESTLGEGTRFTVDFCLRLQDDEAWDNSFLLDLPVLLADDDPDVCESAAETLDSLGLSCEWVTSGEEAVEKVTARHETGDEYYAVILDWKMPGIGGLGAAKAIREVVGDEIPIIIISAYDWADIEQEALSAGVNTFVAKPLFKSRLLRLFRELRSEQGEGASAAAEPTLQDMMSRMDFQGRRVLLAEDNQLNAEIAMEILDMAGLSVDHAENGQAAVERFSASEPGDYSLIFMDIQMPVMDGYAATRAIRALDRPDARTIPIVAMTANAFVSDVQDARDAGMDDHIAKPLEFGILARLLEKYIR